MFQRFHRRPPSTPTSPLPNQTAPWESAPPINGNPHAVQDVYPRPEIRPRSSNTNSAPPFLPPITRVTSNEPAHSFGLPDLDPRHDVERTHPAATDSGFIGGVALQKYRRTLQDAANLESSFRAPGIAEMSSPSTGLPESHLTRSKPPPPPINTNFSQRPPPAPVMHTMNSMPPMQVKQAASCTASPDTLMSVSVPTGKRPAGTRLVSEPPSLAQAGMVADTHKTRKGLPFLKNPMSNLLGRKRAAHHVAEDVPVPQMPNEPAYQPIRGTRVHDFSVPRHQRQIFNESRSPNPETAGVRHDGFTSPPSRPNRVEPSRSHSRADLDTVGEQSISVPRPVPPPEESVGAAPLEPRRLESLPEARRRSTEKPLPAQPLPPIPPRDARRIAKAAPKQSFRASPRSSIRSSRTISVDGSAIKPALSTATNESRFSHISHKDGVASAVPAHMKSTSSRFSFMLGSASQEKIMEERHRQKELERQTNDPEPATGPRDSRIDDFDDDFDYDAILDDDGLEEPIPGVNADYDEDDYDGFEENPNDPGDGDFGCFEPNEGDQADPDPALNDDGGEEDADEEMDPDNDQENFAGFVFQRSNPVSTLSSPLTSGMAATPRDAVGNAIGFAMTKDGTPDLLDLTLESPTGQRGHVAFLDKGAAAGLGIQGHEVVEHPRGEAEDLHEQLSPPLAGIEARHPPRVNENELYFDQGLLDELDFGAPQSDVPFDESIFDNNDTDLYGRPIPGAFAQAQAMRAALVQETAPRGSDATSRLSGQSQLSESTAHTSMSVGVQPQPSAIDKHRDATSISPKHAAPFAAPSNHVSDEARVVAYQAALAEAAHQAAASGKFRRDSSPPPPLADVVLISPTTASAPNSGRSHTDAHFEGLDDYEDDPYAQDMDDYDLDDDDIVAEANASALANDMDDFYGQEFGFYSAPVSTNGHSSHPKSSSASVSAPLNAQNLYEYSNGGYFGPSGLNRSTSGRVVSREPNLTPITERSEYSNRNSIMSLGLPPALGSGGDLRSPGLAQLAMMADDSDMTLSALMRLRNKAFGGSQVSLSPSSREGSPKLPTSDRDGAVSPWGAQPSFLGIRDAAHGRKSSSAGFSVTSALSRDSDVGSGRGSPTTATNMNFGMPQGLSNKPPPTTTAVSQQNGSASHLGGCPPVLEDEEALGDGAVIKATSSMSESALWMKSSADSTHSSGPSQSASAPGPSQTRRPAMGHRHKGSADSISYVKEEDSGEARWIMERRRTAETGEVEVLGREVVTEGRI